MRDMVLTYVHVWLWWLLLTGLLPGHLLVLSVALEAMMRSGLGVKWCCQGPILELLEACTHFRYGLSGELLAHSPDTFCK